MPSEASVSTGSNLTAALAAEMGLTEAGLEAAADQAVQNPYYNPRPITREGIREMLQAAFEGRVP